MYFPRNREFGSALSKLWNFGEGLNPPPLGTPLLVTSVYCVLVRLAASLDTVTNSKPSDVQIIELVIRTESQYGTEWKETQRAHRVYVVVQELRNSKQFTACDVTEGRL
jgi:hypothetical protein